MNFVVPAPAPVRDHIARPSARSPPTATIPRQEAMVFPHAAQSVETASRDEAEIARVLREVRMDERTHEPIEGPGGKELEPGFARAVVALAVDDVVSFEILGQHLVDDLQRVLEIGVHQDDGVAGGASSPAVAAIWWPKFRANPSTLMRRSEAAHWSRSSSVRSWLPSLTRISSTGQGSSPRNCCIRVRKIGTMSSSLYSGMTSDSNAGRLRGLRR